MAKQKPEQPLFVFTSHIDGKNAKVEIWPDRLEWERKSLNAFKVVTGVGIVTGFRNKNTDMLPIAMITGVTSKKGLGLNTTVSVHTAGGTLDFRVGHKEAARMRDELQKLIVSAHQPVVIAQAAAAPVADIPAQLTQLKGLLDAGALTQAEYDAKKTELLARL